MGRIEFVKEENITRILESIMSFHVREIIVTVQVYPYR